VLTVRSPSLLLDGLAVSGKKRGREKREQGDLVGWMANSPMVIMCFPCLLYCDAIKQGREKGGGEVKPASSFYVARPLIPYSDLYLFTYIFIERGGGGAGTSRLDTRGRLV